MFRNSTTSGIGFAGFVSALLLATQAQAATETDTPAVERVADALVAEAFESNLGLTAAQADVDQHLAALDIARARFLPR